PGRTWKPSARSGPGIHGSRDRPGRTPRPPRSSLPLRRGAASPRSAPARPRAPDARRTRASAAPLPRLRLEQLLGLGRLRGLLEHAPGATAEIADVERPLVDRLRDAFREIERLVEDDGRRGRVLTHVVEDGALGATGEDRLGDAFDPDASAPTAAPLVT